MARYLLTAVEPDRKRMASRAHKSRADKVGRPGSRRNQLLIASTLPAVPLCSGHAAGSLEEAAVAAA